MLIDGCDKTFQELSNKRLPELFEEIKVGLASPKEMREFSKNGAGEKAVLKDQFNNGSDFSGCYVLSENGNPVYVGISKGVVKRLLQHVKTQTHYGASLAYRMAAEDMSDKGSRSDAMRDSEFFRKFEECQSRIANMQVAVVEIENPLELYLFEVYCAMMLKTGKWNTFETH